MIARHLAGLGAWSCTQGHCDHKMELEREYLSRRPGSEGRPVANIRCEDSRLE